jgi:hypothetical protein
MILLVFLLNKTNVLAQESAAEENSEFVTVEAEGTGITKIEALNNAWSEAVKKAIGLYMVSKTSVINEDIEEKILAYSRGRVNSYKELSSSKNEDIWTVVIAAEIEKEMLIESVNTYSTTEVSIDGLNLAATMSTDTEKELNKTLILKDFLDDFKYEDFFKITLKPSIENGQLFIYTTVEIDLIKYNNMILNNLNNVLREISIANESKFLNQNEAECNKLILYRAYNFDGENTHLDNCYDYETGTVSKSNKLKNIVLYDIDKYYYYNINDELFELLFKSLRKLDNGSSIIYFDPVIHIEALNNDEVIASTTYSKSLRDVLGSYGFNVLEFIPIFFVDSKGIYTRIIIFKIPFEIDSNSLSKVTKLKANLTFDKK